MAPADRWLAIQEEYEGEWAEWDALAHYVCERLETMLADSAIHGWVVSRAKAPESYTRKVVIAGKPPDEIGDRAGVRVLLPYEADIDRVEAIVRDRFSLIRREQKRDALAYNEIGYLGVHLDIRLRDDDEAVARFGERRVEVQLRTLAQAAWAEVSHEQLYKPPADVPDELKRRIYRLVALVELFDNEVASFVDEAQALPGYLEAVALAPLEIELRERFGVMARADRRLSRELAAALVPLYQGVAANEVYETVLAPWLVDHEDDVRVQLERGAQTRHPLIQQPEILLLFERLDTSAASLSASWPDTIPRALLVDLGQMWGVEIPAETG